MADRKVPPTCIRVGDVDREAVRFCAKEFGVKPFYSRTDITTQPFPEKYNLIFVGSLLTHLEPAAGEKVLGALASVLRHRGQIVFTTQGESCISHLAWYGDHFARQESTYRLQLEQCGVGFSTYPHKRGYGITLHAASYVERLMQQRFPHLRRVRFAPRGWDNHQDVWSYQSSQ